MLPRCPAALGTCAQLARFETERHYNELGKLLRRKVKLHFRQSVIQPATHQPLATS